MLDPVNKMCGEAMGCCTWSTVSVRCMWGMAIGLLWCCSHKIDFNFGGIYIVFYLSDSSYRPHKMFSVCQYKFSCEHRWLFFEFEIMIKGQESVNVWWKSALLKVNTLLKHYNSAESVCLNSDLKMLYVFMITLPLFTFILIRTHSIVSAAISQCNTDILESSLHYAFDFVNIFLEIPVICKTLFCHTNHLEQF
jgi:hypothetical protein